MYHPSRGGVRGGTDQFSWDAVKTDKHRENYLGHSVMAPVGRWQKGKDLSWYAKERKGGDGGEKSKKADELAAIKKAEEDAMLVALGLKTAEKTGHTLNKEEIAEVLKPSTEGRGSLDIERIQGVGIESGRAAMLVGDGKHGRSTKGVAFESYSQERPKSNQAPKEPATGAGESEKSTISSKKHKKEKKHKKKKKKHKRQHSDSSSQEDSSGESSGVVHKSSSKAQSLSKESHSSKKRRRDSSSDSNSKGSYHEKSQSIHKHSSSSAEKSRGVTEHHRKKQRHDTSSDNDSGAEVRRKMQAKKFSRSDESESIRRKKRQNFSDSDTHFSESSKHKSNSKNHSRDKHRTSREEKSSHYSKKKKKRRDSSESD